MDKISILPILKKIPLFADLNEIDHQKIIDKITLEYYPGHHLLFQEGEKGQAMFIIKTGLARIFREEENKEKEIAILGKNDFFGEMALISDQPRNASAITLEESEIFKLTKEDFVFLLQTSQTMANIINEEFLKRIREDNKID